MGKWAPYHNPFFLCLEPLTLAQLKELLLYSNGNAMKVNGGPVPAV